MNTRVEGLVPGALVPPSVSEALELRIIACAYYKLESHKHHVHSLKVPLFTYVGKL